MVLRTEVPQPLPGQLGEGGVALDPIKSVKTTQLPPISYQIDVYSFPPVLLVPYSCIVEDYMQATKCLLGFAEHTSLEKVQSMSMSTQELKGHIASC